MTTRWLADGDLRGLSGDQNQDEPNDPDEEADERPDQTVKTPRVDAIPPFEPNGDDVAEQGKGDAHQEVAFPKRDRGSFAGEQHVAMIAPAFVTGW